MNMASVYKARSRAELAASMDCQFRSVTAVFHLSSCFAASLPFSCYLHRCCGSIVICVTVARTSVTCIPGVGTVVACTIVIHASANQTVLSVASLSFLVERQWYLPSRTEGSVASQCGVHHIRLSAGSCSRF
eukprot:Blabericola_migrator_1__8651@NODE_4541_length_1099_cov_129_158915_g2816_i0_p1_GENE_NODE_4541_length_1099_cov_129_158915_g2816_i0NODE_4541_length_1099_cov_129_158915_g2816_i0_p1_ORF_typecomplete_len132_score0_50_NODE_4541_length_1099_cov_129_158915_g2816_i0423818